jgi:hypothetical protein
MCRAFFRSEERKNEGSSHNFHQSVIPIQQMRRDCSICNRSLALISCSYEFLPKSVASVQDKVNVAYIDESVGQVIELNDIIEEIEGEEEVEEEGEEEGEEGEEVEEEGEEVEFLVPSIHCKLVPDRVANESNPPRRPCVDRDTIGMPPQRTTDGRIGSPL